MAEKDPSFRPLAAQAVAARDKAALNRAAAATSATDPASASPKPAAKGPIPVSVNGREIYRWEQTLDEVLIYVPRPPSVPAKAIDCRVTSGRLYLAIRGSDKAYIDEPLGGVADADESLMTIEDGDIVINVQKAQPGAVWPAALEAHARLDFAQTEQARRALLLERFQRENPGFDFSNAALTGDVPDARDFMGGINHAAIKKNAK